MVRLIALDLDDTLLTTDKTITPGNRQALQACLDRGMDVVTASGRFNESQLVFIKMMDLNLEDSPHLGDGGGTIFNQSRILKTMGAFDHETYKAVLTAARDLKLPCYVTNGANVYHDIEDQPLKEIYRLGAKARRPYIFSVDDLMAVEEPLKFVFAFENQEDYKRIKSIQIPGTLNYSAGRNLLEITMESLNKFKGLTTLAEMYGVTMDEVVCIGDSENDIPMLAGAGLGLAVGNAAQSVKAVADHVAPKTNDEDAVAWLLEKYILG